MLSFLRDQVALWKLKRTPLAKAIRAHTQDYFHDRSVLTGFSEQAKERLVADFCKQVSLVLGSANPIQACREALANYTLLFTQLQVHCLKPAEKEVQFYRGNPYISAELWPHIRQTSDNHDELARYKWETPDLTDDDLIHMANTRCALFLYYANGLNMVRIELGDSSLEKDWFRPFVEACLVNEEHQLREKIGLPALLPDPVDALIYASFLNFVLNGHQHPFFEWARAFPEAYSSERAG